jgi:hypothetical protein
LFFSDDQDVNKLNSAAASMRRIINREQETLTNKVEFLYCHDGEEARNRQPGNHEIPFKRTSFKDFKMLFNR